MEILKGILPAGIIFIRDRSFSSTTIFLNVECIMALTTYAYEQDFFQYVSWSKCSNIIFLKAQM